MVVLSLSSPITPPADTATAHGGSVGGRGGSNVCFCVSPKPKLCLFAKNVSSRNFVVKAQANKVVVDGPTNAAPIPTSKGAPTLENKVNGPPMESLTKKLTSEESISQFMGQVVDLVKLVDSRDIVELQLKQLDCEILIRKKEAIQQAHPPAPVVAAPSAPPPPPPPPAPLAAAALPPATGALPAAPKPAKSSLPPFNCPMAGTFYRCPGPGEPPFVKVGDKVQKGQVLCIIEAMKLMNEIEADQSGTVVEILAEDAKSVSIDTPLFVIQP